ncbi:16S rRNA (cytosine(1402)-N(4))-methyltransferase RsmH [Candidatus Kuenenbacteria bacterium]|nr:16S rRNA (cytosine(1402)-N(4))-methyltransferase RsmH [Candidatus Kuenenbacteria bacterium]
MLTIHKPVLINEVIEFLSPKKNQNFVDCTIGGGGHAEKILELTGPNGRLLGMDWDPGAIKLSRHRLEKFKKRLVLVNHSYIELKKVVYDERFFHINGILLDLGLSSDQLQASGRGFSFQVNEPLDMRYSPEENEFTAADIINKWPEEKIKKMLKENAEEGHAGRIAKAIIERRKEEEIKTTLELVAVVIKNVPRKRSRIHPATKTFQALRMEVNNELTNVRLLLKDVLEIMEPGCRLGIITFHSLEDRIVKQFFKHESIDCHCPTEIPVCRCEHKAQLKLITKKPVGPSDDEISENFRSRSAKLRVVEKL